VTMGGTLFYDSVAPGGSFTVDDVALIVTQINGDVSTVRPTVAYVVDRRAARAGRATSSIRGLAQRFNAGTSAVSPIPSF
jgi:hypothetical protein